MEREDRRYYHRDIRTVLWLISMSMFLLYACNTIDHSTVVDELKCSNLINPEGVDTPLLSWKIKSSDTGVTQTAWEIEIASSEKLLKKGKADIWKSGRQDSDKQFGIQPKGPFKETFSYYWRVRIWDNDDKSTRWSEPARFSIGLLSEASWIAKWVTYPDPLQHALPYFRKSFSTDSKKTPLKALVYFCGLGAGELYLNGRQVDSTRFLDPAQTNYEQYALYSTFDVTPLLQEGDNMLGVMLGDGWFSQDDAWGGAPFSYGDPMFRLQLTITYDDGSRQSLGSDESWEWREGPVRKSNIYLGENYDANFEAEDWNMVAAPPTGWEKALLATQNIPPRLSPQMIPPIRKKEVLSPEKLWQDSLGNWIFDFGVNVAGIPLLQVVQPKGTKITIRYAESTDQQGALDFRSTGWIHHGAIFKDEYICKGRGKEVWSPRFTYHGYRYAELSGLTEKPNLETLKLIVVHSDVSQSGTFECSDAQINQLHAMALRTVKSNLHGIPTDCPIREKCGWLGDVHAYVKMANMNFQMENFWEKYLGDIHSGASKEEKNTLFHERYNNTFYFTDKPAGIPYMIAPGKRLCGVASPDWGTVVVQLPWWIYVYYGNRQILEDYYPQMKQWTMYVNTLAKNKERKKPYNQETTSTIYQGLGDWCPPLYESADPTPVEFTSTAFHYLDTKIMEQVAHLLGKENDETYFALQKAEIAQEMIATQYDSVNKTFGTQTADAMALDLGLVPPGDEKAVSASIVRNMQEKSEGFMRCGIFGISRIGSMLARNGNAEAAWNMFTKKGENSFEWMWKSANATTLWETLPVNPLTQKSVASSSYNHPMQAGFDITFFEDIAGIRPDSTGFGFKVIRFQPLFCDFLPWAKASIETPYGTVSSSWKKEDTKFEWNIVIPPNTTGWVAPPFQEEFTVNGEKMEHFNFLQIEKSNGQTYYKFPSGNFKIICHNIK